MALIHALTLPLDGAAAVIGDGTPRTRPLVFVAGEFEVPFRLLFDDGRIELVNALPWRTVCRFGSVQRLSTGALGGEFTDEFSEEFDT